MGQLTIQQAFDLALQHHQAGRLHEAEQLYRQILGQQPKHAGALHYLGVIAYQVGRNDVAVDLIRQSLVLMPDWPDACGNLGNALRATGQLDEAIAAYRRAVALRPDDPGAHYNLGNALKDKGLRGEAIVAYRQAISLNPGDAQAQNNLGSVLRDEGRLDEAIAAYRQAIALKPDFHMAHVNLGCVLRDKGHLDEAIAAFRQAVALHPDYPEAHNDLGNALKDKGRLDEAIVAFRQAITLKPSYPEAHYNLGNTLHEKGHLNEAIGAYRQAIALKPDYSEALNNVGNALKNKGQLDEAIEAFRQALVLKPDVPETHNNLGIALRAKGLLDDAIVAYRQALALKPDYAEAHNNLGNALQASGQLNEAIVAYRQALALKPDYPDAHSNLVLALHYHPGFDAPAIAQEHRRWNQQHAEPLKQCIRPHSNDRNPDRRLRVGYLSPDFRDHVVGRFIFPLLANHDHAIVEVFGYAQVSQPDAFTELLRSHTDQWRSLVGLSDQRAADLIRRDQVDILVDLAGHTAGSRLLVFARKPAPVQVSYLGYPDTTGLETMDYRLTDALADPPGLTDAFYSERLLRLPQTAWCFSPPPESPAVSQPPSISRGHLTFGTFNNFAKVSPIALQLWARIMQRVPGSHLLLKGPAMVSPEVIGRLRQFFASQDIAADRLELIPREATPLKHLQWYHRLDVALDSFPYHGTTTTCEALWMGVPVVTLAGQTHVSRVGASLLSSVGLGDLVARSEEQYVKIAVELANDRRRLNELRQTLRQRMEGSPLMDASQFARNIEAAYRQMWRNWCATVVVL